MSSRYTCRFCARRVSTTYEGNATSPRLELVTIYDEHGCEGDWMPVDPPVELVAPDLPRDRHIGLPGGLVPGSRRHLVLGLLLRTPAMTSNEVGRQVGCPTPAASKALQVLRRRGYVEGTGGWGQMWSITEAGKDAVA